MKLLTIPILTFFALTITSCDRNEKETASVDNPAGNANPVVSKHEELANQIMDSMKDFAMALSSVTDLETANEASIKIGMIGDRFIQIASELRPLDPPANEIKEAIKAKMEARDAEMHKLMGEDLQKIMQSLSPEARQVLQEAFEKFFGKMNTVEKEFERHFNVEE